MVVEDLRPGDWVVWNGRHASVTHTVGVKGQAHPWQVGLRFEGVGDAAPFNVVVAAGHQFDIAF